MQTGPFMLTYGEVISHEPSLAGGLTAVLCATFPMLKDRDLVVKISWPGSERAAGNAFLGEAVKKAESVPTGRWALNPLPQALFAQDVVFNSDSTHEKVVSLFDGTEFVGEEYKYERHTLQIIIQERLYPLKTLTNVRDVTQVMLDVLCNTEFPFTSRLSYAHASSVHQWLYDRVGIMHRDLSLNNIMYQRCSTLFVAAIFQFKLILYTRACCNEESEQAG